MLFAALLLFLITGLMLLSGVDRCVAEPSQNISFHQSASEVDTYCFVEVTLSIDSPKVENPFTEVVVEGKFGKTGETDWTHVDGFCDSADGSVFRIRFMPSTAGDYSCSIKYRQGGFEKTYEGEFCAVDGKRLGILRIDQDNPWHFIWEGTGEHYFWNGTTTYYLMGWQDEDIIRSSIDRLHDLKINRLRVLVYGRNKPNPWRMPVVPTDDFKLWLNPWVAERPDNIEDPGFDLTRFNVSHWQKYERLLSHAREKDMIISVIFYIGGQVLPTPFAESSEDEHRYYRYGIARLAAFSNVTWDLGNEHDFHREYPGWADGLGKLVKKWDPYNHLTSAHNKIYRTPESTWIDIQLIQRWDGGQNGYMLTQREQQKEIGRIIPQVNEEYGYEDLWEKSPGQRSAETRRRLAWEIYMAGCYQTAGESARQGTGVPPDTGGGWVNGRGDDTMTMLEYYTRMVDFFTGFQWWKTEPRNDLVDNGAMCLAEPGNIYAIYLPSGGKVTVNLEKGKYRANWLNPRTGEGIDMPTADGPVWTSPNAPDDGDWLLLLKRSGVIRNGTV